MKQGIKITREEANQIILEQSYKDLATVTLCWKAQWYDIRHLDEKERWNFISSLINVPDKESSIEEV